MSTVSSLIALRLVNIVTVPPCVHLWNCSFVISFNDEDVDSCHLSVSKCEDFNGVERESSNDLLNSECRLALSLEISSSLMKQNRSSFQFEERRTPGHTVCVCVCVCIGTMWYLHWRGVCAFKTFLLSLCVWTSFFNRIFLYSPISC